MNNKPSPWSGMICPNPATTRVEDAVSKYPEWVRIITGDSLRTLLWAVGLFGTHANMHKESAGRYPHPCFDPRVIQGAAELIPHVLEEIAENQSGKQFLVQHNQPVPKPAFTAEFSGYLLKEKYCEWAAWIGEPQFDALLTRLDWLRIRTRHESLPQGWIFEGPSFDVPVEQARRLQAAVWAMWSICHGIPIELAGVKKRTQAD